MSGSAQGEILACHECDLLHRYAPIAAGAKASCHRCGAFLYRHVQDSLDRSLALYVAALLLFILANVFPFLSLTLGGRVEDNVLLSSAWAMYEMGMGELGVLIFLTSIGFPLIAIVGMLYLLILLALRFRTTGQGTHLPSHQCDYAVESGERFYASRTHWHRKVAGSGDGDPRRFAICIGRAADYLRCRARHLRSEGTVEKLLLSGAGFGCRHTAFELSYLWSGVATKPPSSTLPALHHPIAPSQNQQHPPNLGVVVERGDTDYSRQHLPGHDRHSFRPG